MRFTIGLPITKTMFLGDTLEGISNQKFKDYELIIRNNASTPQVKAEIKSMCLPWLNQPNVIYIESAKQVEMHDNFNEIVKLAKGDYFTMISDDDVMQEEFLEEFNNLINVYPNIDVFHCRTKYIDEDSNLLDYTEIAPSFETLPDFLFHRLTGKRKTVLSDFVVLTKALQDIGGFTTKYVYGFDTYTWFVLSSKGLAFTPKILLDYRISNFNYTNDISKLVLRFDEIKDFKQDADELITSECFKKQSPYPEQFMLKKNVLLYKNNVTDIMYEISKRLNVFEFILFYLKNYKAHDLPFKLLVKYAILKFTTNSQAQARHVSF